MGLEVLLPPCGIPQKHRNDVSNMLRSIGPGFPTDLGANDVISRFFSSLQTVRVSRNEFAHSFRSKKQEINRSEFLKELGQVEFELDEEETRSLIDALREPNPNARKFRVRARQLFESIDLTEDEIPLKTKSK